jgi:hypothetical protein
VSLHAFRTNTELLALEHKTAASRAVDVVKRAAVEIADLPVTLGCHGWRVREVRYVSMPRRPI